MIFYIFFFRQNYNIDQVPVSQPREKSCGLSKPPKFRYYQKNAFLQHDVYRQIYCCVRHWVQPSTTVSNKNIKMISFKSSENIQKKEGGPDRSVSDNQSSSVTLNELAMKARKDTVISSFSKEVIH